MNNPFSSSVRSTRRSALLGGLAVGTGLPQLGAAGGPSRFRNPASPWESHQWT
jgi:hypothetical protein